MIHREIYDTIEQEDIPIDGDEACEGGACVI